MEQHRPIAAPGPGADDQGKILPGEPRPFHRVQIGQDAVPVKEHILDGGGVLRGIAVGPGIGVEVDHDADEEVVAPHGVHQQDFARVRVHRPAPQGGGVLPLPKGADAGHDIGNVPPGLLPQEGVAHGIVAEGVVRAKEEYARTGGGAVAGQLSDVHLRHHPLFHRDVQAPGAEETEDRLVAEGVADEAFQILRQEVEACAEYVQGRLVAVAQLPLGADQGVGAADRKAN